MFLTFHVEAIGLYNTEFVDMCMIYQCAKFHMPNRNASLSIAVKSNAKCRYYAAATTLTCTLRGGERTWELTFARFRTSVYHT